GGDARLPGDRQRPVPGVETLGIGDQPDRQDPRGALAPVRRMGPAGWLSLVRGLVALALGSAILFYPDKTRPFLGNFIGLYWLVSGVLCLRWTVSGDRARGLSLAAGLIGVLGGLLVLARFVIRGFLTPSLLAVLLGTAAVLAGSLHMIGGFR